MFGFIKKYLFTATMSFGFNKLNVNPLECVSMHNQKCRARSEVININSNEHSFYTYSISGISCSGSCNNINDPYAKLCVPDVVKNINLKVLNLMSRTSETRHIGWYETCMCKCTLNASI